jgi:sugar/nucleoside kinase (ribokinase family)
VVGAASRDLTPDDPRGWRLGGAVSYGSLTLGRLGVRTRALVGADAEAAEAEELEALRSAGIEVCVARLAHGPVFRNLASVTGRVQQCVSVSSELAARRLPQGWALEADAMLLGPVADELSDEWALAPRADAYVALGWQGLLRALVEGRDVERTVPAARPLVSRANLVGVSADDIGDAVRMRQLVDLVAPGASLVVTRGDRGGTLLTSRRPARSALRAYPAIPSNDEVDPTGAGDVFLASLVAAVVDGERLGIGDSWADRLAFAAAAGSLAVEGPGLAGVPSLELVRRRVADIA